MQVVADLHLHSKYSRAVSPNMTLPVMAENAMQKGIDLLTASDWTHPVWMKEIQSQLEDAGEGVYQLKTPIANEKYAMKSDPLFLLSTEISSIYKQGDKLRRIHNLVFAPNFAVAEKIIQALLAKGANLSADGRPIVGLSSKSLLELILSLDERCLLIPCHVWTPHFGVYGSASGFDSLEEAFGDMSKYIYGIETGLSSDPEMNWQIKELQNRSILSFSDAHSAPKMGREATVFELSDLNYESVRQAIMQPMKKISKASDTSHVLYTMEFYPEEGKYHYSGHRNCKVVRDAEQIRQDGNICPVCHKRLTEGVLYRLQQLSDKDLLDAAEIKQNEYGLQWYVDKTKHHPPFVKLVPLLEIVAESMGSTVSSQKVKDMYLKLVTSVGSEFDLLLKTPIAQIVSVGGERVGQGVEKVREGAIEIAPGFDGEYGKVAIWKEGEKQSKESNGQLGLDIY